MVLRFVAIVVPLCTLLRFTSCSLQSGLGRMIAEMCGFLTIVK